MRTLASLAVLSCAIAACDPSSVFIDPTGKACFPDAGKGCPGGWTCDDVTLTCYASDGGMPDAGSMDGGGSGATTTGGTTGTGTTGSTTGSSGTTSGGADCSIQGQTVAAGAANPMNLCQLCAPSQSTSTWSSAPSGQVCDAGGNLCVAGSCIAGCDIAGAVVPVGMNALNPCQSCEALSPTQWSNATDGQSCGTNTVCKAGTCEDLCVLDAGVDSGVCGCASGVETCNGVLVDTCVDDGNCGGCAEACGAANGCFGGSCGSPTKMPTSVTDAAALLGADQRIYVLGGLTTATSVTNAAHAYDPRADRWSAAPSLVSPRAQFGAAETAAGDLYALGGIASFSGVDPVGTASAEVLHGVGATGWSSVSSAPAAFWATQAAKGTNGLLYLPGGVAPGPSAATQTYDPAADAWATGPSLRVSTAYCGAATGADGTLYSFGGTNTLDTPVTAAVSAEALRALDGGWALVAPMPTPRCDVGTATDSAGLVYTIGGNNCAYSGGSAGFEQYALIEIFNPDAGLWVDGGQLLNGAQGPACVAAADGRIFCMGGYDGTQALSFVQVYNPKTHSVVSSN